MPLHLPAPPHDATMHDVIIVGAGPTGLMLAGELALAGVDVVLLEQRPDQRLSGGRALGITARTIEVFDQRGIAQRFLEAGQTAQVTGFAVTRLDISDFPTRHPYGLALRQKHIERLLAEWVRALGVTIRYAQAVADITPHEDHVAVTLGDGRMLRASYLVGCDGGRSLVRKRTGIDFPGWDATMSNLLAEVEVTEAPPYGVHRSPAGTYAFGREEYELVNGAIVYKDIGPYTVMVPDAEVPTGADAREPTLDDLRARLHAVCGTDYGVHSHTWISRFTDMTRQAAQYRAGRVLLAGDAAHVHAPHGGQGLSLGVQDAVNLGWKLAQVVRGVSPSSLLDSYHAERHPVGARVLSMTMAQVALLREDERTRAAREVFGEVLQLPEARRHLAGTMSGLDVRYALGSDEARAAHPLLGRRMPDLELVTAQGSQRVYTLLHQALPFLLTFGAPGVVDLGAWRGRVPRVDALAAGPWTLPVVGDITPPRAVFVRPDGYVAWVGDGTTRGLADAFTQWCGAA